jgi:hypothetical protein
MDKLTEPSFLRDYIPARLNWANSVPSVDWVYCDETRYREAFFESTLDDAMRRPFNLLFRHTTPIDFLLQWAELSPGIQPSGLIYHVSRCGSTLLSSLLAKLDEALVLSEPSPLDAVVKARMRNPNIPEETQVQWLRGMVSALGQRKEPGQTKLFIKLDAWHLLFHGVISKAFPNTPALFLYRDPVEVMASTIKQRASFLVPNALSSALFNVPLTDAIQMPQEEFCARALAQFYQVGLELSQAGKVIPLNYTEMPDAVWTTAARHFNLELSAEQIAMLKAHSNCHPKNRGIFEPDSEQKRNEATALTRECCDRFLYPSYWQLEELRAKRPQAF